MSKNQKQKAPKWTMHFPVSWVSFNPKPDEVSEAFKEKISPTITSFASSISRELYDFILPQDQRSLQVLNATISQLTTAPYSYDPIKRWKECKAELEKSADSPVIDALKSFADHVLEMHENQDLTCLSPKKLEDAMRVLHDKGTKIAEAARERKKDIQGQIVLDDKPAMPFLGANISHEILEKVYSVSFSKIEEISSYILTKLDGLTKPEDIKAYRLFQSIVERKNPEKDPIHAWGTLDEELKKIKGASPVVRALQNFTEEVVGINADILDSVSSLHIDTLKAKLITLGVNVAAAAEQTRLGKEEFKVLFEDKDFAKAKVKWEESRDLWSDEKVSAYNARSSLQQAEAIEKTVAETRGLLKDYAATLAPGDQKISTAQAMLSMLDVELLTAAVKVGAMHQNVIASDAKEVESIKRQHQAIVTQQEEASITKALEEKTRIELEAKAAAAAAIESREVEAASRAETIGLIIKSSIDGSGLTPLLNEKQKGEISRHLKQSLDGVPNEYILGEASSQIRQELSQSLLDNITKKNLFGSKVDMSGLSNVSCHLVKANNRSSALASHAELSAIVTSLSGAVANSGVTASRRVAQNQAKPGSSPTQRR